MSPAKEWFIHPDPNYTWGDESCMSPAKEWFIHPGAACNKIYDSCMSPAKEWFIHHNETVVSEMSPVCPPRKSGSSTSYILTACCKRRYSQFAQ
jgi:hypothetical protein